MNTKPTFQEFYREHPYALSTEALEDIRAAIKDLPEDAYEMQLSNRCGFRIPGAFHSLEETYADTPNFIEGFYVDIHWAATNTPEAIEKGLTSIKARTLHFLETTIQKRKEL